MASEITISQTIRCVKGDFNFQKTISYTADQATAGGGQPGTVAVTTTDTAISISGLSAPRLCAIRNIGSNPVKIGPTSGGAIVAFAQLAAGEGFIVPLVPSVALRAQTTTGTSTLEINALET